jgi:hypothetical protein
LKRRGRRNYEKTPNIKTQRSGLVFRGCLDTVTAVPINVYWLNENNPSDSLKWSLGIATVH